jgi:hypothetical protein
MISSKTTMVIHQSTTPILAAQGAAAARREGKRERESRGIDSPTHHELGRREEAGPRGPAVVGRGVPSGGAVRPGRGCVVARAVVVAEGCAEALFIGWDEARARRAG